MGGDQNFSDLIPKNPSNPFRFVDGDYLFQVLKETDSLSGYRQYQHNNYVFSLLGNILEGKSKMPYELLVENRILKPLNMNSTSFNTLKTQNRPDCTVSRAFPGKPMALNRANPAGGLASNTVDMTKYVKAYLIAGPKEVVEKKYYEDRKRKLGLGWEIGKDFLEKDGDTFGNLSLIRCSMKNQIGVVVLSNHQNGKLVRDLMNRIYDVVK